MKTLYLSIPLICIIFIPTALGECVDGLETFPGRYEAWNEIGSPAPEGGAWYSWDTAVSNYIYAADGSSLVSTCSLNPGGSGTCTYVPGWILSPSINNQDFSIHGTFSASRAQESNRFPIIGINVVNPSLVSTTIASLNLGTGSAPYRTLSVGGQCPSGTATMPVDTLTATGSFSIEYDFDTTTLTTFVTATAGGVTANSSCSITSTTIDNIAAIRFSGSFFRGCELNPPTCTASMARDIGRIGGTVWNAGTGTFTLPCESTVIGPSEFDSGLLSFIESTGFKTPASQMFFVLVLVGLATIGVAFATSFFGEGTTRTWLMHSTAVLVGLFSVLLLILKLWIFVLCGILSTVAVRGWRETLNTFRELSQTRQPATDTPGVEQEPKPEVKRESLRNRLTARFSTKEPINDS